MICYKCKKILTNSVSISKGIGPDCAAILANKLKVSNLYSPQDLTDYKKASAEEFVLYERNKELISSEVLGAINSIEGRKYIRRYLVNRYCDFIQAGSMYPLFDKSTFTRSFNNLGSMKLPSRDSDEYNKIDKSLTLLTERKVGLKDYDITSRISSQELFLLLTEKTYSIISAGTSADTLDLPNSELAAKEGHKQLERDLKRLGIKYIHGDGFYKKGEVQGEKSIVVVGANVSELETIILGIKYSQESVIHSDNGFVKLVYTAEMKSDSKFGAQEITSGVSRLTDLPKEEFLSRVYTLVITKDRMEAFVLQITFDRNNATKYGKGF